MNQSLDLATIIVSWNVRDYLAGCLTSVYADLARAGLKGAVWVVDNGSTDGTQALLADLFPQVHLIQNTHNEGFGAANNRGVEAVRCAASDVPYLFLLNPDTVVRPGALRALIDRLQQKPQTGVVGARLVYGDGRFQHSAFRFPGVAQLAFDLFPLPWRLYESRLNGRYPRPLYRPDAPPFAVDFVLGAAMMLRRPVVEATGGFDEAYHMYCEEIDWCWRIRRAGWEIEMVPQAEIVHFGGESTRQVPAKSVINLWESRARLYRQYHGPLRLALARRVARLGLRRAARRSAEGMRAAYEQAAAAW